MSSCTSHAASSIEPPVTGARRPVLIYLVSALMAEATFFAVLSPLLPEYAHQLHLGKVGVAVLAASYSFGYGVAAIPTGVVVGRLGARAVSIGGLVLVGLSCAVFAVGASAVVLDVARVATGIGATAVWAGSMPWLMALGSDQDRGRLLGLGFSAASAGICLGPVVGALATVISQRAAFLGLAGLIVALGLGGGWASRGQAPPLRSSGPESALGAALRAPAARWSLAMAALPSLGFGVAGVLLPLRLRALGVQTTTIAAAFVAAAALEVFSNPLVGRWSDRSGASGVLSLTLIASAGCVAILALPLSATALLVALAIGFPVFSSVWLPSLAQLSASLDAVGAQPGVALGLFNICWAACQTVGALGGAQLASVGEAAPFLALLSLYVWGSVIALRRR